MDRGIDGQMHRQMDRQMDRWMDRQLYYIARSRRPQELGKIFLDGWIDIMIVVSICCTSGSNRLSLNTSYAFHSIARPRLTFMSQFCLLWLVFYKRPKRTSAKRSIKQFPPGWRAQLSFSGKKVPPGYGTHSMSLGSALSHSLRKSASICSPVSLGLDLQVLLGVLWV